MNSRLAFGWIASILIVVGGVISSCGLTVLFGASSASAARAPSEPRPQGMQLDIDAVSVQFKVDLLQASTVCELASGRDVHSAEWSATRLPPGLRFIVTPRTSCPARIEGTATQIGTWSTNLRATVMVKGAHGRRGTVSVAKQILVSVVAYHPPVSFNPTIDWASGLTFASYDNVGANAIGDCSLAAAADYEQIAQHSRTAPAEGPWLAEYASLAAAAGETPGPDVGVDPPTLFQAWESVNQTGTQIASATPISTDVTTLSAALAVAPILVEFDLPVAAKRTLSGTDFKTGIISTPWTSANTGPYGPTTSVEEHTALLVGVDQGHHEFLVLTWGQTYALSYSFFESMVVGAWTIKQ
jgi:hypothetical protein